MYLRYHAFGTKENLHNFKTSACCYGILFSAECLSKLIGVTVNMATALARHTTADSIVGSADSIVGSSKAISELRSYLPKVALSNANVLITGATGTGKERVAEQIHRLSARRGGPFVCINCAAIPDSLLESELFGHERGAFTGADQSYAGKIRFAEAGTLFLDEVGEMSLQAQAKLLRLLENRELFPLGGAKPVRIEARFIAATNQDLEPLVKAHKFRADLFFRMNVARIHLPPLAERKEDIPHLLRYFLNEYNLVNGYKVEGFTPELMICLLQYDWPGNVRELRNLVEALFVDPPSGPVSLQSLPDSFRGIFYRYIDHGAGERERIITALHETNWNKTRAARLLRVSRMTLYRKMAKFDIDGKSTTA